MIEQKIADLIQKSTDIAIIAHISPDGDTLGSSLALGRALSTIGKNISLFCQDTYPVNLMFMKGIDEFSTPDKAQKEYSLCIAVDCSDIYRMGNCYDIFKACPHTVNIDHHISNNYYAKLNLIDPDSASTGELIFSLINHMGIKIDKISADALYIALSTDTGSFNFGSTTSKTYRIAAELVDLGVNVDYITKQLYRLQRPQKVLLLKETLNTLEFYDDNRIAVLTITMDMLKKTGADDSDTENLVNYAINIIGVHIGFLIKEVDINTVKVSFRSNESVDIDKLAADFGGGGHKKAAGATINLKIDEAKTAVLEAISRLGELSDD